MVGVGVWVLVGIGVGVWVDVGVAVGARATAACVGVAPLSAGSISFCCVEVHPMIKKQASAI